MTAGALLVVALVSLAPLGEKPDGSDQNPQAGYADDEKQVVAHIAPSTLSIRPWWGRYKRLPVPRLVDLTRVVSKLIGETDKNLERTRGSVTSHDAPS